MKKTLIVLGVLVVLVVIILLAGPFYIVHEGEQAVVVRLGRIVDVETEAGLKFKTPFIDNVVTYSAKILSWDGDAKRMPTAEQQFIWVDTTARWRIEDPRKFYTTINTMNAAANRLDGIIDSAVRTIISRNSIEEAVRNSNIINEVTVIDEITQSTGQDIDEAEIEENLDLISEDETQKTVEIGRLALSNRMLEAAQATVDDFGIELIDVVIRQIRYSDDLTESVYERMITERNRIAQFYRALGEGQKQRLLGELENQKRSILSEAYRQAEEIKGSADAQAAQIYSQSYSQNTGFFNFWRSIESYRRTIPGFEKVLSTELDYFQYLDSPQGR
ncbi:protease modulator HflC [Spirochaeta lutea]|uniref:Protein HflC n=1 Tax=Spirochaeta lutea TaxID=1480694 RepID=A0A098R059_9SPIO|nr:protease modulator HflC [Spirochaeta lutea]KGE73146.1 membane protease HflC [Spirochaeta lutea]